MMTHYRNSTQIICDLLVATRECGREGIKTTALLSKSNLSHSRLKNFVSRLTSSGLMDVKFGKNYVITEKGIIFLEEYKRFYEFAGSFGLEM
tara:strand:+ start:117 stop:392 length:276 start_codon:yes stop_codon:yes gene_type:complete